MGCFLFFFFFVLFAWGFLPQKPANRFVDLALSVTASAAETRNIKDKDHLSGLMSDGWRELEADEWGRLSLFSSCGREERAAVRGGA